MDISLIGLAVVTLLFIWLHKRGEKNKRKHGLKEIPGPKGSLEQFSSADLYNTAKFTILF